MRGQALSVFVFFFYKFWFKKKNPQSHYFKTSTSFTNDSLLSYPLHLFLLSHILIKVTISSFPHTYTIKIIWLWNMIGKRNWRGIVIWQSVFLFHPLHMYTRCPLSSVTRMQGLANVGLVSFRADSLLDVLGTNEKFCSFNQWQRQVTHQGTSQPRTRRGQKMMNSFWLHSS